MKRIINILCIVFLFFLPLKVNANIICNDGTRSKSCTVCSKGCCSRHGGCNNNSSYSGNNYSDQSSESNHNSTSPSSSTSNSTGSNSYDSSYNSDNESNPVESEEQSSGWYYLIILFVLDLDKLFLSFLLLYA